MEKMDFSPWRIAHATKFSLNDFDSAPPAELVMSDDELKHHQTKLADKLNKLQSLLYASKTKAVLLVLQGMDTSGKDGVIRHVFSHVSPLGMHAIAFGAPTELEQRHDFLWRIHNKLPALGDMTIFNRSHYEDVLVTRVRGWVDKPTCEKRYKHIEHFESLLNDSGTVILKCFLHISRAEQKKRLQARLDDPAKHWKLQPSDFADRKLWPDFMHAYTDAMAATSTKHAPWYVVPADSKPHRDLFIASLLVQTLHHLDLQMPKATFSVDKVKLD
jgi:PPK2 family polyphosphate:nucleotide phosphotransferase